MLASMTRCGVLDSELTVRCKEAGRDWTDRNDGWEEKKG